MTAKPEQNDSLAAMLIAKWEELAQKIASLAVEIPEEKFEYRPVEGARTFGGVLRHLAFWHQYVADSLNGSNVDESSNEVSSTDYATKPMILGVLDRSSGAAVAALRRHLSARNPKAVELAATFLEHTGEHYGQLAVYSRLMGITPPASRS